MAPGANVSSSAPTPIHGQSPVPSSPGFLLPGHPLIREFQHQNRVRAGGLTLKQLLEDCSARNQQTLMDHI